MRESPTISVDPALCRRCGTCAAACPSGLLAMGPDGIETGGSGRCIECGHCVAICPEGAIDHSGIPPGGFDPVGAAPAVEEAALRRLMRERRSFRVYGEEPVSREEIERLIGAARHSPTSTNSRDLRWSVFFGAAAMRRLSEWTAGYYLGLARRLENPFARLALSVAVGRAAVGRYRRRMPAIVEMLEATAAGEDRLFHGASAALLIHAPGLRHLAAAGCALAGMQILLAAESMGLGACFNGYALTALVRDARIKQLAGLPRDHTPGAVIAVGRPAVRFRLVPPRGEPDVTWIE